MKLIDKKSSKKKVFFNKKKCNCTEVDWIHDSIS